MVTFHRHKLVGILWVLLLLPISGCSSQALQRALAPDPNAGEWGQPQANLPEDFPAELRYVNARLQSARTERRQATTGSPTVNVIQHTNWITPAPLAAVRSFYQGQLGGSDWQQLQVTSPQGQTQLTARRQKLRVRVTIMAKGNSTSPAEGASSPAPEGVEQTTFTIEYYRDRSGDAPNLAQATPKFGPPNPSSTSPESPDANVTEATPAPPLAPAALTFSDLDQAPPALQSYLQDLAQLGVLTPIDKGADTQLAPKAGITRGTFAQWLVQTNNRLYQERPTRQIRLAPTTNSPLFKDVPTTSPFFPYVQGLAEAGYLPSSLSGDSDALLFRPNQPLTRETLLTWKVPVDLRRVLPTATAAKVKEVWGFKDTHQITPTALAAILADHQNGDLANVRRILGSALLLQPQKHVTRAEAAAALWFIGIEGEGFSAQDIRRAQLQSSSRPQG